jgi:hypothetical protein
MDTRTALFLLLVLACPLLMLWMHGFGHRGHGAHHGEEPMATNRPPKLEELRRKRDELDAMIEELQERESEDRERVPS